VLLQVHRTSVELHTNCPPLNPFKGREALLLAKGARVFDLSFSDRKFMLGHPVSDLTIGFRSVIIYLTYDEYITALSRCRRQGSYDEQMTVYARMLGEIWGIAQQ
jgi:hypothetical protein